jgi:predicted transcriptional regulator
MTDIGNVITTGPRGECAHTGSAVAIAEGNTTTKAELLSRAKNAIESGDQSLREAADALALAQEDFDTTQREIAEAVGKSAAWVNRLLRWRRESYPGSPFGPGSKARRERQKSVQAPEQRAPRKIDADNAEASTEKCKTECAKREAEPKSRARRELAEIKYAIDFRFPHMDEDARHEAIAYAVAKDKSCASGK